MHADELLQVARRASAAVPRAFLRVDLYDGPEGAVFGESTPEPGGAHRFRPDVDRWMGRLWEEAEARLQVRAAAFGALDPQAQPAVESAVVLGGPLPGGCGGPSWGGC